VIASYRGHSFDRRLTIALCPDRVIVHTRWLLRGDLLQTVRLNKLDPDPSFLRGRHSWFSGGITLASFGGIFLGVSTAAEPSAHLFQWACVAGIALGLGASFLSIRKIQIVQFCSASDGKVQIYIPRKGVDREKLDEFVLKISRQIAQRDKSEPKVGVTPMSKQDL
jgi:hypothetical protein